MTVSAKKVLGADSAHTGTCPGEEVDNHLNDITREREHGYNDTYRDGQQVEHYQKEGHGAVAILAPGDSFTFEHDKNPTSYNTYTYTLTDANLSR